MSALSDLAQREARIAVGRAMPESLWESTAADEAVDLAAAAALGALASPEVVQGIAEHLWESVDDKGIRGRLYREDCDYLAAVVVAALTGEGAS